MSHSNICLNCENPIAAKYCDNCGQKTDTHRITFKHFIFHDILHGVWHFEKGILFTIKETLIRPGSAAIDYINGKRIKYYNVFYLTILLIGFNLFMNHIFNILNKKYAVEAYSLDSKMDVFLAENAKLFIFSLVPLLAILSFTIYRRKKLNLSEHFIISGIFVLGILIITTLGNFFYFFDYTNNLVFISDFFNTLTPIVILFYIIFGYSNAFKDIYSTKELIFRAFLLILLFLLSIILFGLSLKKIIS